MGYHFPNILTSPTIQGTVKAGTGLTFPAFTMGGDLTLGANLLKTTNLALKEYNSSLLALYDDTATNYKNLRVRDLQLQNDLILENNGRTIASRNSDDAFAIGESRQNTVGLVEIFRMQGAADPYFALGGSQEFKFYNSGSFELGGTVDLNGQTLDAGSGDLKVNTDTSNQGLYILYTASPPSTNDISGRVSLAGYNDNSQTVNYGQILARIADETDTTEDSKMEFWAFSAGSGNNAFYFDGAGELYADADGSSATYLTNGVNLFDEYDDALELRRYAMTVSNPRVTIQQRELNRERMVELGIFQPKIGGYGCSQQQMNRLLAGGVWQNRQMLEQTIDLIENLSDKVTKLEEAVGCK